MPHKPSNRDKRNDENRVTKPGQRRSNRKRHCPARHVVMTPVYLPGDTARVKRKENALNNPNTPNILDTLDESETITPVVSEQPDDAGSFGIDQTESLDEFVKLAAAAIEGPDIVAILEAALAHDSVPDEPNEPEKVALVAEELQRFCESIEQ
jgi:hypothetical protein